MDGLDPPALDYAKPGSWRSRFPRLWALWPPGERLGPKSQSADTNHPPPPPPHVATTSHTVQGRGRAWVSKVLSFKLLALVSLSPSTVTASGMFPFERRRVEWVSSARRHGSKVLDCEWQFVRCTLKMDGLCCVGAPPCSDVWLRMLAAVTWSSPHSQRRLLLIPSMYTYTSINILSWSRRSFHHQNAITCYPWISCSPGSNVLSKHDFQLALTAPRYSRHNVLRSFPDPPPPHCMADPCPWNDRPPPASRIGTYMYTLYK